MDEERFYALFEQAHRVTQDLDGHREAVQQLQQLLRECLQALGSYEVDWEVPYDWDERLVVGVIFNSLRILNKSTLEKIWGCAVSFGDRWTVALNVSILAPDGSVVEWYASFFLREGAIYVKSDSYKLLNLLDEGPG